jgi:hypothetical protein
MPNRIELNSVNFEELYCQILLEVLNVESGLQNAAESFRRILITRGLEVNPDIIFTKVDLINTRVLLASIVKQLCNGLGLHAEYEQILQRELDLIYNQTPTQNKVYTRDSFIPKNLPGEDSKNDV